MKPTKKLFLGLSIMMGVLFALACVSIIFVFVYDFAADSANVMATVYLFLHLIILAIAFYMSMKAFFYKSALLSVIMIDERGNPIIRSKVVCIVISSICLACAVYATLLCFNIQIPLSDIFTKGLKFALMNVFYSVGFVSLFFVLYQVAFLKENVK